MRRRTSIPPKTATIGLKIRLARLRSGLTQAALADQIRTRTGPRSSYKASSLEQLISRLERGKPIAYRDHVASCLTEIVGPLDAEEPIDHFSRPIWIDISKDGTTTYRQRGTPPLRDSFPIFSVCSEEEARQLQRNLCWAIPLPDPRLPHRPRYVLVDFAEAIFAGADFGDLFWPTVLRFAEAYAKLRS